MSKTTVLTVQDDLAQITRLLQVYISTRQTKAVRVSLHHVAHAIETASAYVQSLASSTPSGTQRIASVVCALARECPLLVEGDEPWQTAVVNADAAASVGIALLAMSASPSRILYPSLHFKRDFISALATVRDERAVPFVALLYESLAFNCRHSLMDKDRQPSPVPYGSPGAGSPSGEP